MKSFLIIGMGSLGHHLCNELSKNGCEIMVADINAETMEDIMPMVVSARVCDCTKIDVLKTLGVEEFDACFVCIEDFFQACLEITDLLKDLGAKKVYSVANRDVEEKFLLRNGAYRVIYPERDVASRIAGLESAENIFDCINISAEYSIFEIEPLDKWIGKTVTDLDFRNRYELNIIAVKKDGKVMPIRPDYMFTKKEHLLVLGHKKDVCRVLK
jgi:trk system potassium uptake protein TrkA